MLQYWKAWVFLGVCVAVPAFAWVKVRGQMVRQGSTDRESARQDYLATRKRHMAKILAEKLGTKSRIEWRGVAFDAVYDPVKDAVWVSSLGASPYLPTESFVVASELLSAKGRAPRGDAMRGKLGEPALPLDSIEGVVAKEVFQRAPGAAVYRRIGPLTALMVHLRLAEYDAVSGHLKSPGIQLNTVHESAPPAAEMLHSGA